MFSFCEGEWKTAFLSLHIAYSYPCSRNPYPGSSRSNHYHHAQADLLPVSFPLALLESKCVHGYDKRFYDQVRGDQ